MLSQTERFWVCLLAGVITLVFCLTYPLGHWPLDLVVPAWAEAILGFAVTVLAGERWKANLKREADR